MRAQDIGRLLRTVSHLRATQIWHRARLTVRRKLWSRDPARIDARYHARAAAIAPLRWDHAGLAAVARQFAERRDPAAALGVANDVLAGRFRFLGETRDLGAPVQWDRPDLMQALLWKTHLHEFSYAIDLALAYRATRDASFRDGFFALAHAWTDAQPIAKPGFQRVAWNERAVATRLVHWAAAGALFELRDGDPEAAREASWLGREIARHALFLRDNLALDLLANHLFRDTAALAFAHELCGCVPDGLALFEREVREQILADGAHVERCPMYHAVCLADLVDLRALCGEASPAWLRNAVARAAGFLESILLGDGDIPMLGDGWRGEVDVQRLLAQARALEDPVAPRAPESASGIVRLARGPLRCVLRAGPHGPDHQLGHAHADLLAFDVSCGAVRVVTDTGTGAYADGPLRRHLRSTAAHNTVQLDGAELLEAWSSFRSGRRGRARVLARGASDRFEWLVAAHDGYAWLAGAPQPQRLWLVGEDELWILDAVLGAGRHQIANRLHLHPDAAQASFSVRALGGDVREQVAPLHEHFNETREMRQLVVEAEATLPWLGGFWLRFGATPDAHPSLTLDDRIARLRLDDVAHPLAVDWDLGASGADAVAIR
jgi:uncharacterized heparinase superfamily protein